MFCISSLASAGYGTALGVIRSLHTEGVLERAYCTETRPFNQVSVYSLVVHSFLLASSKEFSVVFTYIK